MRVPRWCLQDNSSCLHSLRCSNPKKSGSGVYQQRVSQRMRLSDMCKTLSLNEMLSNIHSFIPPVQIKLENYEVIRMLS